MTSFYENQIMYQEGCKCQRPTGNPVGSGQAQGPKRDGVNLDIGLASEGSFGPHPLIPFLPWNVEIVLLVDNREN